MGKGVVKFKHSGNLGDVIYALPSIKKYCEVNGVKAEILLIVGAPMWLPDGFSHPSGGVMLTRAGVEMLAPLLEEQHYIHKVVWAQYGGNARFQCDIDLDLFRSLGKMNLAMGSIARYYQPIFGFAPDAELPWLSVGEVDRSDQIVVARSSRYRNPNIDYSCLNGLGVKFLGVQSEFDDFKLTVHDAVYVKFENFLDMARFIQGSRFVIANQTFIYSIAEAMKVDRILEPCLFAGNVIPIGGNNFEAFTQDSFKFAVDRFAGRVGVGVDGVEYLKHAPWHRYLESRKVDQGVAGNTRRYLESSPSVVFIFVVDATHAVSDEIRSTLRSFYDHKYAAIKIVVIASGAVSCEIDDDNVSWISDKSQIDLVLEEIALHGDLSWVCHLRAGDLLGDYPLELIARHLRECTSVGLVYPDEDVIDSLYGPSSPMLKPDFNLDYLRSYPYVGRFLLMRGREYLDLGGLDHSFDVACFYDYVLRYCDKYGESGIAHIPEVLFHASLTEFEADGVEQYSRALQEHLRRCQVAARIEPGLLPGGFRVYYLHDDQPLVSIIIPTKNQFPILQRCLEGLLEKTSYKNYEVILVDNQSTEADARHYLQGLIDLDLPNLRVLSYPHPFNFSDMNNLAAQEARGEYLVLLNNDTAIVKSDWLDALLNHARRPDVGIVGAKLLYPDGSIQHAGVILGLRGPADHPFVGEAMDAPGYCGRLLVDQQYSAVTAACMMVRKSVYEAVGGMDADSFKVSYNDVDLCLKVRELGYRIIWTPYAVVMHEASVSQNLVDKTAVESKRKRFESEQLAMYRKWMPALISDPAYNPNLSLSGSGFQLEMDHLFNPNPGTTLPRVLAHNADQFGSGCYRVIQPLQAIVDAGMATGVCRELFLDPIHAVKAGLDVIVLQRQTTDAQLRCIDHYREFSGARLIYELDDYLPNMPTSSEHKGNFSRDVLRRLRQVASLCDRMTVSTYALKQALDGLHSDIVVLPNYLPARLWSHALRRNPDVNRKPRVGWAGGVGHAGDLRVIADVVKAMADRVEWVFFGMYPKGLESCIAEYYPAVAIEHYPQRLAALNLDLALAPLEQNQFNECKSNLRLLEYGVCGYPVIATDIEPYRCGLPVTLVKNRYKDWVAAIEEKLSDRLALRAEGEVLQGAVRKDWMLEGTNLVRWYEGWMLDEKNTKDR